MSKKDLATVKDCMEYESSLLKEIDKKYSELIKNLSSDEEFLSLLKNDRIVVYKGRTNIVIYYDDGVMEGCISAANSLLYSCSFNTYQKAIALDFFNSKGFEKWKKRALKSMIKSIRKYEKYVDF